METIPLCWDKFTNSYMRCIPENDDGIVFNRTLLSTSALSRKRIGLISMAGVYIVLAIGIVIAFLTLMAEIYWNKRDGNKIIATVRRYASDFFFKATIPAASTVPLTIRFFFEYSCCLIIKHITLHHAKHFRQF